MKLSMLSLKKRVFVFLFLGCVTFEYAKIKHPGPDCQCFFSFSLKKKAINRTIPFEYTQF